MEHPYRPARVSRGVEFYRGAKIYGLGWFMVHNVCGYRSMELRWNEVFLGTVWSWTFTDTSVNFDVHYRVFRRQLGVVLSFTCVVRVRTTTTCTPSATARPSRWTAVVETTERRRKELFVRNKENLTDRTMNLSMTFENGFSDFLSGSFWRCMGNCSRR